MYDLIVVGGGAAGFFGAIQSAEAGNNLKIGILESGSKVLTKVKISGGGRCNVTHSCFVPNDMILNYPRGEKELRGSFHKFLCGDMMEWLEKNGVPTKIEEDGRVFPNSDDSQSIIDCFLKSCQKHNIEVHTRSKVEGIEHHDALWKITTSTSSFTAKSVLWATGSSPSAWRILEGLGLKLVPPVPSLFTFKIQDGKIQDLPGLSVPNAQVKILGQPYSSQGPLLITHWGLSGPAILKLSAWAARKLAELNYQFEIQVNWLGFTKEEVTHTLEDFRKYQGSKKISNSNFEGIPKRLWLNLLPKSIKDRNWADLNKAGQSKLIDKLVASKFKVNGQNRFKEEFVTAGGVETQEVNFTKMEAKGFPGLFLAGEVINIDAITGGFNFQAAWTEAYIAAQEIVKHIDQA